MTKAQQAIQAHMTRLINSIDRPLSCIEEDILIDLLKGNKHPGLWGMSIRQHFESGEINHHELVNTLAAQCMDDPFVMACTLSMDVVILLLRSQH